MSTVTSKQSKATALARVQALIAGTQKHFPNGSFTLGNVAYTTASLIQLLQGLVDALTALSAAQATAKDTRSALKGIEAKVNPVIRDYKRFLLSAFDGATQALADFGMQPSKVRKPLDAEQRAAAAAKLRATRKARGTTSRKQKLAVKGDVTGVVVTPVTAAAPQAPAETAPSVAALSAQPSPSAPNAPPSPAAPPK